MTDFPTAPVTDEERIRAAKDWLDEQRAVVHPGPIETIREALSVYAAVNALAPVAPAVKDGEIEAIRDRLVELERLIARAPTRMSIDGTAYKALVPGHARAALERAADLLDELSALRAALELEHNDGHRELGEFCPICRRSRERGEALNPTDTRKGNG